MHPMAKTFWRSISLHDVASVKGTRVLQLPSFYKKYVGDDVIDDDFFL